ncbi:response regulator [Alistipes putredinis]|nr:response regulator [Alistipes putredinis]
MGSESMLQEILWDTKIGWWKVDMARRVLLLSDYLCKTIGTEESEIGYDRFLQSVGEPFRASLKSLMSTDASLFSAEQIFSLCGPRGEVWFRWKVLRRETAADKGLVVSGYAQEISEREALPVDLCSIERMNTLLYRLNNISHTLLSFLHIGSIDEAINKVLTDVLKIFRGSRTYIAEFDWDNRRHICTYEVTDKGVESGRDRFDRLSMDETPWWVEQLEKRSPIALSCLDDLPSRARNEHDILAAQNIGSLFVLPMTFRDKLWGYAGIDVIGEHRDWQNEDYQWFASLVNIINICIELQRSKREAQIERDYLQNLYRYMPLGYVRFRMIYDKTGTPVDYKVLDSNYAAEKIIGKSQADYVGRLASELEIEDMPEYLKVFAKVLQVEQHVEKEVRLLASGRYVHVVMYSTTPEEVICLLSDMTEMYETHEALDRSEKLLRNIYDNIPVGIELYDRNGLLVDLNNKDLEIFGIRDKEDVLGVDFFKNPILDEEVWRRVRNREEFSFKAYYPFDRLNGYYVTSKQGRLEIYSSVCMLYDAQGRLSNFFLINIDNTEINRAHSRIAEFESSFSLVSRFGKVGYCRFDLVSKEGYGVPQWYYNLGEKEDTPLDQILGVYKHVNSSDRAEVLESIRQVKAGEIDSFSHDLRIDADGRQKWTRINVMRNPLNNDPSKIEMVCVNYDITELKETEKNLIEAKNKAEVSDRLKSAFLANMSHEIRTPLNAIVGFSNLIAETEDPDERREYVAIVQENNELLLKLISDILDLSKIEAGTLEFNDVEFDVNQMCQEIVRSLSLKVLDKPVELRFGDHLPECRLVGDKTRITQVLINFINNALKFTREGSVTLGYRCDDGMMLTFYVEDTGTGIPEQEQEQESVFERFVKLNSFVQGTGLGLAISKSIVEQMGGRIGLNSEPGKGSCFWFTHPYIRTRSVSAVASDAEMRQPGVSEGKMPVVLVAEDTDSNFLLVSLILKKGYEVLRAHNGAEAVRMCREFAPDVVLMDMKMPVMDGLEATRQIREAGSSVPIIAVTAYAYDSDRAKALDVGCDDYIAKPLTGDVLKKKLRKHLKR